MSAHRHGVQQDHRAYQWLRAQDAAAFGQIPAAPAAPVIFTSSGTWTPIYHRFGHTAATVVGGGGGGGTPTGTSGGGGGGGGEVLASIPWQRHGRPNCHHRGRRRGQHVRGGYVHRCPGDGGRRGTRSSQRCRRRRWRRQCWRHRCYCFERRFGGVWRRGEPGGASWRSRGGRGVTLWGRWRRRRRPIKLGWPSWRFSWRHRRDRSLRGRRRRWWW